MKFSGKGTNLERILTPTPSFRPLFKYFRPGRTGPPLHGNAEPVFPPGETGDIIEAGENFGCGSSREHAPIAIKAAGVSCVIASSFARIFYRNAINIGLPILECDEAVAAIEAGDDVEVNLDTGSIRNLRSGKEFQAVPFPEFMQGIMNQGGLINYIQAQRSAR